MSNDDVCCPHLVITIHQATSTRLIYTIGHSLHFPSYFTHNNLATSFRAPPPFQVLFYIIQHLLLRLYFISLICHYVAKLIYCNPLFIWLPQNSAAKLYFSFIIFQLSFCSCAGHVFDKSHPDPLLVICRMGMRSISWPLV